MFPPFAGAASSSLSLADKITTWQTQLGSEFIKRWLAAPEDPTLSPRTFNFFYEALKVDNAPLRSQVIAKFWPQFLARARQAPVTFDPAALQHFKRHFEEIGQPGGDKILLAQLDSANRAQSAQPPPPSPSEERIELPRLSEIDAEKTSDLFSMPALSFPPPLTEPAFQKISFPKGTIVKGVQSIVVHDHTLWLQVEAEESANVETPHDLADKEFAPLNVNRTRLWRLSPGAETPVRFGGLLASNTINSMTWRADVLWLALNDDGIAALDAKTGVVRRYEKSAGITSMDQFSVVATRTGVASIGGISDFLFLTDQAAQWLPFHPATPHQNYMRGGSARRLAVSGTTLLYYNSELLLCDLSSNTWTFAADRFKADRFGPIDSLTGDARGHFWILTFNSLHELDPATGKIRSQWIPISPTIQNTVSSSIPEQFQQMYRKSDVQLTQMVRQKLEFRHRFHDLDAPSEKSPNRFVPASRLSGRVLGIAPDGDFLWVLTQNALLLYHPESHHYLGGYSLAALEQPCALACSGADLWVAARQGGEFSILKLDSSGLKSIPRDRWVTDIIPGGELSTRLASLSAQERIRYDFFTGNNAAVIRELHKASEDELNAESLFFLATAHAEIGETGPAAHFQTVLKTRFPENIFVKALKPGSIARPASPVEIHSNP